MFPVFVRRQRFRLFFVTLFAMCANGQRLAADENVLTYLNQSIAWYRDIASLDHMSGSQKEGLFADNLRESSLEAVRSAFQFGRADATFPAGKEP